MNLSPEFWSAVFGSIVGGMCTIWAATKAHQLQRKAQSISDKKLLYDTTNLILVEISTAIDLYMEEYGRELLKLPEGEAYINIFPVGENTFPVYDSSPSCLSQLDPELSALIVRLYMRAKGMIRMIELNNADTESIRSSAEKRIIEQTPDIIATHGSQASQYAQDAFLRDILAQSLVKDMASMATGLKSLTLEILNIHSEVKSLIDKISTPKKI
jgi:hypothetical protein